MHNRLARYSFTILVAWTAVFWARNACAQEGPPWAYVEVYAVQDLDFEVAFQGEGPVTVTVGDANIAKFEVRGKMPPGRGVTITLIPPPSLRNGSEKVPYELEASYNVHQDDPFTATPISGNTVWLRPQADKSYEGKKARGIPHASAYIYVYGTAIVGHQSSGTYTGEITLEARIGR